MGSPIFGGSTRVAPRDDLSSLGDEGFFVFPGASLPAGKEDGMLLPGKDEFVRLAADHDVVPVAREVYADLATPISAFLALADGARARLPARERRRWREARALQLPRDRRRRDVTARSGVARICTGRRHSDVPAPDPLSVVARTAARRLASLASPGCRVHRRRGGIRRLRGGVGLREGPAPRRRRDSASPTRRSCSPTPSSPSTTRGG